MYMDTLQWLGVKHRKSALGVEVWPYKGSSVPINKGSSVPINKGSSVPINKGSAIKKLPILPSNQQIEEYKGEGSYLYIKKLPILPSNQQIEEYKGEGSYLYIKKLPIAPPISR